MRNSIYMFDKNVLYRKIYISLYIEYIVHMYDLRLMFDVTFFLYVASELKPYKELYLY